MFLKHQKNVCFLPGGHFGPVAPRAVRVLDMIIPQVVSKQDIPYMSLHAISSCLPHTMTNPEDCFDMVLQKKLSDGPPCNPFCNLPNGATINIFAAGPFPIFSRNPVYVSIAYSRLRGNKIFHLKIMST